MALHYSCAVTEGIRQQWLTQNRPSKQTKQKGSVKVEVAGTLVVPDAVGGLAVVFDAVGELRVALYGGERSTRSPSYCSACWALVFDRRFRQNAGSTDARRFDAGCVARSPVLS